MELIWSLFSLVCRFASVAYLQQIWWFEVDGEVEFPFPAGTYSMFFRLQLGRASKRFGRRVCNTEHVHGWDKKPAQFQLWTSDGQHASSQCILNETGKWIEYHIGDFVVDNANASTKIKFSMTQIDCTHTKGGLTLDSACYSPQIAEALAMHSELQLSQEAGPLLVVLEPDASVLTF
ncbi:hypothetical protein LWI28_013442 [Acer negundo]|uniref:Uncharacterized protein n=1 Tax=Acer negundo TaxID=4023 RepID=A0AAD5IQ28_ACENE|nr:hypothetical protein LWI28_013442 [Acer negundo]